MNSFKRILILTKRNIKEIVRDPLSIIFLIALPLLMQIMFYFLFHAKTSQFEMKYLAPGIVVFSQSFLTLFTGLLISVDRSSSFLTRLYVSKAKSYEFIFSYALSVLPLALIQAILFFLVGGIIDTSLFSITMLPAMLLSVITSLFFIAMGILFGSICNERSVGGVASVIISSQSLLSGIWFPIDEMSGGFITFMEILPFRNASLLVQNTLIGINDIFNDFFKPLLILLGYIFVAFVIAIILFKKKMKNK